MSADAQAVLLPPENIYGHRKKLDFFRRHILELASRAPAPGMRFLDIGCSNGQHLTIHLGDLAAEILAIDPHVPSINFAAGHNPYPDRIAFTAGTINDIPADRTFDVIVMADVLEHLERPGELFDQARNRLNQGGILLVSIPNGFGPFEIESALERKGCLAPSYWIFRLLSGLKGVLTNRPRSPSVPDEIPPYADECGHVQHWRMSRFKLLVSDHGLAVTSWGKGPWLGARCTSTWWGRSAGFCAWNSRIGDLLPAWAVSTWYFRLEPKAQ